VTGGCYGLAYRARFKSSKRRRRTDSEMIVRGKKGKKS
jgi:hypothetical protein